MTTGDVVRLFQSVANYESIGALRGNAGGRILSCSVRLILELDEHVHVHEQEEFEEQITDERKELALSAVALSSASKLVSHHFVRDPEDSVEFFRMILPWHMLRLFQTTVGSPRYEFSDVQRHTIAEAVWNVLSDEEYLNCLKSPEKV